MTKEAKKIIRDPHQEDSSLLKMNFANQGLSWVKNIRQKFETTCEEYLEVCSEYVNTTSENIKKICEEITGLDLKDDTTTSDEASIDLEKKSSNVNALADDDQQLPTVSILEDSAAAASSMKSQALSREVSNDEEPEERLSNETISCSDDSEEWRENSGSYTLNSPRQDCAQPLDLHHDEGSSTVASSMESQAQSIEIACNEKSEGHLSNETSDPIILDSPRQDCGQLFDSRLDEEPLTDPLSVPLVEENGTYIVKMGSCNNDSCSNDYMPQLSLTKFEICGQFRTNDTAETSDSREDFTSASLDMSIHSLQSEEFETIKLEDCSDDALEEEIALISQSTGKNNMSFKKKLKKVFSSRKRNGQANHQNECEAMITQSKQTSSSSSVPSGDLPLKLLSSQDSIGSDWEIL